MENSLAFKSMMNFTSYPLAGQVDGQSMEFAHWRIMEDAHAAFDQGSGKNLDIREERSVDVRKLLQVGALRVQKVIHNAPPCY